MRRRRLIGYKLLAFFGIDARWPFECHNIGMNWEKCRWAGTKRLTGAGEGPDDKIGAKSYFVFFLVGKDRNFTGKQF